MSKITWPAGTLLAPVPPALISSGTMEKPNVMTAAWTGVIASEPAMTYVSIRPSRYSHEIISKTKEFVINLPDISLARATDFCGVKSGRDIDKFQSCGLTPLASSKINTPQIKECPISLECQVTEIRTFGTHDMFIAKIIAVDIDDKYLSDKGAFNIQKANLLAYAHGFYYTLGRKIGKFGFSVEKKKTIRKRRQRQAQKDTH
ncbi:MAG: flavin reductase family protein [Alphaproteobacteria bacterium]|nr:flavin reductase family protein [Alphaproteobacteria bacterium]